MWCFCVIVFTLPESITSLTNFTAYVSWTQTSSAWTCEGCLMLWPVTAHLSSTSTVIHQGSGLWTLGAVFSFPSSGSYGSCAAAAAACWTGLSEGSVEDKAGAYFNNACCLEATSGQRPILKRCFKDTPRPTHVQEPIKNRKSGRTKQHASAEGPQSLEPVIN